MPIYLCEECARCRFSPDLTLNLTQIWLRSSSSPGWPMAEWVKEHGFGPKCDICGSEKTSYQLQIVGIGPYAEPIVGAQLREHFLRSVTRIPA